MPTSAGDGGSTSLCGAASINEKTIDTLILWAEALPEFVDYVAAKERFDKLTKSMIDRQRYGN